MHHLTAVGVQDYKEAIQDEDFSKAAHLRDWGNTSLVGWWWPQSNDPRNPGHLLRIVPALNHYVGVAYSPVELSVLHVRFPPRQLSGTGHVHPCGLHLAVLECC